MPLYDYLCPKCGHRFDQLVKLDQPAPPCPKCGAKKTDRQSSWSAAVSTTTSREKSLVQARGKAKSVKREQDHAHQQYIRQHMKDHD